MLARDSYTCQRCQILLTGGKHAPNSPVVDHIDKDTKNSVDTFYDPDGLQAMCKQCHDSAKQSEEIKGYSTDMDDRGYPIDPRHPANR